MRIRNLYSLGRSSRNRAKTTSSYLQLCLEYMIQRLPIDCGVPWMGGRRTAEEQNAIFKEGNSGCDGYNKKSNHQRLDDDGFCLAIDVVPYVVGIGFDYKAYGRFGIIGAMMLESWDELKEAGVIPQNLFLHWGGFWRNKKKGSLGWDMAHYEIREYEQKINLAA